MKNILTKAFCFTAVVVLMGMPYAHAVTVTDNFSDLNDTANPVWTHLTGDTNSTLQTFDASTGQYHLAAPTNGVTLSGNQYGFAGSYVQPSFGDVHVMADLVGTLSDGVAYGVAAHLDGNNAFNGLKGYAYVFEQIIGQPAGVGEMALYRLNGLTIADIGNDGPASRLVTLDLANKDYTFLLDVVAGTLYASLTEVGGGVVAYQQKADATYASGFSGLFAIGARSTTLPISLPADVIFDNFLSQEVPEPATSLLVACGAAGAMLIRRRQQMH